MDLQALSGIEGFTATSLLITSGICLAAVFVAWYTVRGRIQMSQVILGVFSYLLVMLLENVFSMLGVNLGVPQQGMAEALYLTASIMVGRELIRALSVKYVLQPRYEGTDAAIGFGLGFGALYLLTCAAYYFSCYSTVNQFLSVGAEAFFSNVDQGNQEAYDLLKSIAGQNGWQYIMTAINRVLFLVREIAFSVLVWYGLADSKSRWCLAAVPAMQFISMLPDSLYSAGVLSSTYVRDVVTYVISGGVAFLTAKIYNSREDQVAHFKVEKLRARRRR